MAKREKEESAAEVVPTPSASGEATAELAWQPPAKLSRNSLLVIAGVIALVNLPMIHYFVFRSQSPAVAQLPVKEDFANPDVVTEKFWSSGGLWRVENGQLLSPGVKNNPLWLKADLPNDVAVEFDVRSMSPEGDVKVEIFGDGTDHASGYVLIHGGWNNSISIIARLDEHGATNNTLMGSGGQALVDQGTYKSDTRVRVEASPFRVDIGRTYRWRVERRGKVISWFIDGQPFMRFEDPLPLTGKGHNRFGFSSWEAQLYFDNLSVTAL
jgi:hypothetical protein